MLDKSKWIQPDSTLDERRLPYRVQELAFQRQREEESEDMYRSWQEATAEACQELKDDVEICLEWQLGKPEPGKKWADQVSWKPWEHLDRNLIQLSRWLAGCINKGEI